QHFKDLDELLEAVLEREGSRALGQLAAVLPSHWSSGGDAREGLLAGLRGYLEAIKADPITWRLVMMPPEGAPRVLRDQVTKGREAIIVALAEVVRPGLSPDNPSPDPDLTARLLSALSDEAARLMLTDPDEYPIERLMAYAEWLLGQLVGAV